MRLPSYIHTHTSSTRHTLPSPTLPHHQTAHSPNTTQKQALTAKYPPKKGKVPVAAAASSSAAAGNGNGKNASGACCGRALDCD